MARTDPDLTVICGPTERDVEDRHAAVNPTVLFEVLSPLRQYVLLDHARPHVDVYTRLPSGGWERRGYGLGQSVPLTAIEVHLDVNELYEGWVAERAVDEDKTAHSGS